LLDLLGLLSRIRVGKASRDIQKAARQQYLFPVVGAIIGLATAVVGYLIFEYASDLIGNLLAAVLLCMFLYSLTGIIHIEGLADFADGLMASGDIERKRSAMKDVSLGAGGSFAMLMDIILEISLLSQLNGNSSALFPWFYGDNIPMILGIIIAEISGKLAMNTSIRMGPSSHAGMGRLFVDSSTTMKFLTAIGISLSLGIFIAGIYGFIVLIGSLSGICVTLISRKHFGGVGGDSLGAANEVGRLAALLAWVVIL